MKWDSVMVRDCLAGGLTLLPLGGFQNQISDWDANLSILKAASLDGYVDESEEVINLFGGEFDFNHAAGASETGASFATGFHGSGSTTTGG